MLRRAGQRRHRARRHDRAPTASSRAWTSSWSVRRRRSSTGWPTQCAAAGIACFGPLAAAARLEGSKAFAKEVMAAAGVPTGGYAVVEIGRRRAGRDRRLPGRHQGRRAGGRQGRRDRGRRGRGARGAGGDAGRAPLRRRAGGGRGVPRRRRALAARDLRRRDARSRWRRRATTSASATATPARTPAGWAASRRCRRSTTRSWSGSAPRSTSRWWTSSRAAARRSTACSTRA